MKFLLDKIGNKEPGFFTQEKVWINQLPKGIKWSAVCIEFFLCFLVGKQGSGPYRGQSPIIVGEIFCLFVCPFGLAGPEAWLAWPGWV